MSWQETIEQALGVAIARTRPLAGGDSGEVRRVELEDGRRCVAKTGSRDRLDGEVHGLDRIAAVGVLATPRILGLAGGGSEGLLLLEALDPCVAPDWGAFGRALARHHAEASGERYGLERDNHLGPTPQSNDWRGDWIDFNRECRHGPLVERLSEQKRLAGADLDLVHRSLDAFDTVLPRAPHPSLLHGDLWSGNVLPTGDGKVAVIDPAVSIGDGLADIAMMQLFGGFPAICFEAYFDERGVDRDPRALAAYRLYHLLNHLLIFGGGYRDGVVVACREVIGVDV